MAHVKDCELVHGSRYLDEHADLFVSGIVKTGGSTQAPWLVWYDQD